MAQKPDGKPARTERVTFTRPAAERIAKAVRAVEGGDRDTGPLTFGARMSSPPAGSSVRFAHYTATTNWSVVNVTSATNANNTKVIQFAFPTTTPFQTALCVNHMAPLPLVSTNAANAQQLVLALKDGGMWRLIGAGS